MGKIENKGKVDAGTLDGYLKSHWIDVDSCRKKHIVHRAKMLLNSIEEAAGKSIFGRDSEEVIEFFGNSLK